MSNLETLGAIVDPPVLDDEDIARFLVQRDHFNAKGHVTSLAFMPPKSLELSVFRYGSSDLDALWRLGPSVAGTSRTLYGAAILNARVVSETALRILADGPPRNLPRHAIIVGWPTGEIEAALLKAQRRVLASRLADAATLFPTPGP